MSKVATAGLEMPRTPEKEGESSGRLESGPGVCGRLGLHGGMTPADVHGDNAFP